MEDRKIYITNNDYTFEATIFLKFNILDDYYCIYTIQIDEEMSYLYNSKIINGNLVNITNPEEKIMVDNITKLLTKDIMLEVY